MFNSTTSVGYISSLSLLEGLFEHPGSSSSNDKGSFFVLSGSPIFLSALWPRGITYLIKYN